MATRVPLRARIGFVLILTAAAVYGGWEWWMATRTWVPLDMPISLAQGHIRSPEFKINLDAGFWIFVEEERKFDPDAADCLIGYGAEYCRKSNARPLRSSWTLSDSGKVVAQGSTDNYQAFRGGMVSRARGLGDFAVSSGEHYVLDVDILEGGNRFDGGHPRLWIAPSNYLGFEEDRAHFLLFSVLMAAIGTALMVSAIADGISKKREAQSVSLTAPGPSDAELKFEEEPSAAHVPPLSSRPPLPVTMWIGFVLVLLGITVFTAVQSWMSTRIFKPVDMPASLAAGHIRTGPFRVNLKSSYEVAVDARQWWEVDPQGVCYKLLQTRWNLYRDGKIVDRHDDSTQDPYAYYYSGFDGTVGVYDLDVEVLHDASCLNAAHPRLQVWTDKADYEFYAAVVQWAAVLCIAVGASLLIIAWVGRVSARAAETTSITGAMTVGQNFQWAQRLPLRRPISGLPSFGLIGGIMFAIFAMLMIMLTTTTPLIPKGLWAHVLKPGAVPENSDTWAEPLVVLVKDAGLGRRPNLYLNSRPVAWEDLDRTLKQELGRRRDWVVYVGGDYSVAWQNIVDVIDVARGNQARVLLVTADGLNGPAR